MVTLISRNINGHRSKNYPRNASSHSFTHPQSVQADTNLHSSGLSRITRSGSVIVAREELVLRSSSNTNNPSAHNNPSGSYVQPDAHSRQPDQIGGQRAVIKGNLRHVGSPPGPGQLNLRPAGLHISACRTKGTEAYSTPIYGVLARRQPQIFRCWSPGRGLCDRLIYAPQS